MSNRAVRKLKKQLQGNNEEETMSVEAPVEDEAPTQRRNLFSLLNDEEDNAQTHSDDDEEEEKNEEQGESIPIRYKHQSVPMKKKANNGSSSSKLSKKTKQTKQQPKQSATTSSAPPKPVQQHTQPAVEQVTQPQPAYPPQEKKNVDKIQLIANKVNELETEMGTVLEQELPKEQHVKKIRMFDELLMQQLLALDGVDTEDESVRGLRKENVKRIQQIMKHLDTKK